MSGTLNTGITCDSLQSTADYQTAGTDGQILLDSAQVLLQFHILFCNASYLSLKFFVLMVYKILNLRERTQRTCFGNVGVVEIHVEILSQLISQQPVLQSR